MRVLVIGADPDQVAEYLKECGHDALPVYANDLVLKVVQEKGGDTAIYFTDAGPLGHDRVLKDLRAAGLRVILVADPGNRLIPYAAALGVKDILLKPLAMEKLLDSINNPAGDFEAAELMRGVTSSEETNAGQEKRRMGLTTIVKGMLVRKDTNDTDTGRIVLLAAGDDTKPLKQELQKKGMTVEVCRYREQLPGAARKRKTDAVILSASLPGAVDLADLIPALDGVRVILLPGARDDPSALKTAGEAARLGVKDIAWDISGAIELVFHPAVEADLPAVLENGPEERVDPGTGKPPGKTKKGRNFLFKVLSIFDRQKEPVPLPAVVEPVYMLPPAPVVRAAVLGLAVDFPTVPVEEAQVIFCSPGKAPEALGQAPPGAKVYLAGEGATVWRDALRLGISPVSPDKIQELITPAASPQLQTGRKCLLVYSSKTAVGKTSISVTMAVLLASMGKKVCLVDLDGDGKTASWLFLGNRAVPGEQFYPTRWGVDVICLPDETRAYNRLAAYALNNYDAVVVDCPGRLQMPRAAEAFMGAAMVFLVSSCSSASVAAVRSFIEGKMGEYEIDDRTALVINRSEKLPPLQPGDVKRQVGFEPTDELPFDPLVDRMFSARIPMPGIKAKKKPFESAVMELLQQHLPEVLQ